MKYILTILLTGIVISSTIVASGMEFFDLFEQIELTKLSDLETEDKELDKEKEDKIRNQLHLFEIKMEAFQKHAWIDDKLFAMRYGEILTPPPDLI